MKIDYLRRKPDRWMKVKIFQWKISSRSMNMICANTIRNYLR